FALMPWLSVPPSCWPRPSTARSAACSSARRAAAAAAFCPAAPGRCSCGWRSGRPARPSWRPCCISWRKRSTCSFGGASRGRSAGRSASPGRVDSAGRLDGEEESDLSMLMLRSSMAAAADVGRLHQVGRGVLFAADFERQHLAAPDALALFQRVLARLGAEESLHGGGEGLLGLLQLLLCLLQAQLRCLLLFAEPVDMRLALLERQRERDPRRRRFHHPQ